MPPSETLPPPLRPRLARGGHDWPFLVAIALAVLTVVALAAYGWSYYRLSFEDRMDSDLHRRLRSSGGIGRLYAYVGVALILGNLLYLVRRRLVNVVWLGSMRSWMSWHVFSGIVGPAFILLHSAFTLRTWPATTAAACLVVVVVTGVFGRYLYQLVPRLTNGRQAASEELAGEVDRAVIRLRDLGPGAAEAAALVDRRVDAEVLAARGVTRTGFGSIVRALGVLWRLRGLGLAAGLEARKAGAGHAAARTIGRAAAAIGRSIVRIELIDVLSRAASWWRGWHRNLVLVMVLMASLHITIAIYTVGLGL